jgi:hypothetical protein
MRQRDPAGGSGDLRRCAPGAVSLTRRVYVLPRVALDTPYSLLADADFERQQLDIDRTVAAAGLG